MLANIRDNISDPLKYNEYKEAEPFAYEPKSHFKTRGKSVSKDVWYYKHNMTWGR